MRNRRFQIALVVLVLHACGSVSNDQSSPETKTDTSSVVTPVISEENKERLQLKTISLTERNMLLAGLVDVQQYNPNIEVNLRYAGTDNFLRKDIYGKIDKAYMATPCAEKLGMVQTLLDSIHPEIHLLVWDAARPVRCQQIMWDAVDFPVEERVKYVSNPANRSLHNFGCAVDVTLKYDKGDELDMGTGFDDFDTLAQPAYESKCLASGALSDLQVKNRKLLRHVMVSNGFRQLQSEWWHYNCVSRDYAKEHFTVVE